MYGYLNDTEHGRDAKELIKHGDIAMSIGAHRIQNRVILLRMVKSTKLV